MQAWQVGCGNGRCQQDSEPEAAHRGAEGAGRKGSSGLAHWPQASWKAASGLVPEAAPSRDREQALEKLANELLPA